MYCKDCKFWVERKPENTMACESEKIQEECWENTQIDRSDMLMYPYYEGGYFETGPNFGCVHFEQKQD